MGRHREVARKILDQYIVSFLSSPVRNASGSCPWQTLIQEGVNAVVRQDGLEGDDPAVSMYRNSFIECLAAALKSSSGPFPPLGVDQLSRTPLTPKRRAQAAAAVGSLPALKHFLSEGDNMSLKYILPRWTQGSWNDYFYDIVRSTVVMEHTECLKYVLTVLECSPELASRSMLHPWINHILDAAIESGKSESVQILCAFMYKHNITLFPEDELLERSAAAGCSKIFRTIRHFARVWPLMDDFFMTICKYNRVHLVRRLVRAGVWTVREHGQTCLRMAERFYCRDVVETLVELGVDINLNLESVYVHPSLEKSLDNENLSMVKTLLLSGAIVSERVAEKAQLRLKDHGFKHLEDFEGTEEEVVVAYLLAKRMEAAVLATAKFDLFRVLVEDVEESKIWSAKVALERQDPWFLAGSKTFGHHLLSLGF